MGGDGAGREWRGRRGRGRRSWAGGGYGGGYGREVVGGELLLRWWQRRMDAATRGVAGPTWRADGRGRAAGLSEAERGSRASPSPCVCTWRMRMRMRVYVWERARQGRWSGSSGDALLDLDSHPGGVRCSASLAPVSAAGGQTTRCPRRPSPAHT